MDDPGINFDHLVGWFRNFNSCIVAFSAGVDSSLLAVAAKKALGKRAYAVTSISPAFPESERKEAELVAGEIGIELIQVTQDDLNDARYVKNDVSRCYFCRSNLAVAMMPVARMLSVDVCVDGTHKDDLEKPRPGVKALREGGFRAPFSELGFGKQQIRDMALFVHLSNWNKPSEACLSSRVAYGHSISLETLSRIERAENVVKELTGAKVVRVRTIGRKASIEVDNESLKKAFEEFRVISEKLKYLGYENVEIDPAGYVSGRMLELFVTGMER